MAQASAKTARKRISTCPLVELYLHRSALVEIRIHTGVTSLVIQVMSPQACSLPSVSAMAAAAARFLDAFRRSRNLHRR
eukprot:2985489-Amphidinium_carterae.1